MVEQHSLRRGEPKWLRESRLEAVERFTPDAWPAGDDAMLSRTIVVAERDSSVTLVEDLTSEGEAPRIAVPHVEVHAGAGSRVTYVGIRRLAPGVLDLGFQRFRSARDSDLRSLNVFAGEGRSKVGIESDIEGDGAVVKLFG